MESTLSPDKEKDLPPVPIKTYQWEDLRRAREAGGYPWTYLLKVPLEGEVTAEDIIRETTPQRSMSRELTRSRTHSPVDQEVQRILNLDSSPGSSRKHGEEGEDQGVHIPNFSKEISLDDDTNIKEANNNIEDSVSHTSTHLTTPTEVPRNVSPKSILKRRTPEPHYLGTTETREKSKCCHPLVNKIKHLADKTLQKLEKNDAEKSPLSKRKKQADNQEIRQLKSSPGAVRRQKFSAIKLGDSDEMSKTMSGDTPPTRKRKEHIYEDIEDTKEVGKSIFFSSDVDNNPCKDSKENGSLQENKSNASLDPSLVTEDNTSLKADEHIMEKLHSLPEPKQIIKIVDDSDEVEEPTADEIFQNQLEERASINDSPNITITEIVDDFEYHGEHSSTIPIESSPSPVPHEQKDVHFTKNIWSKPSSDHEYEIIEKPPSNVAFNTKNVQQEHLLHKTDDELSSTTSLERKYIHTTSEEEFTASNENMQDLQDAEEIENAKALQKDIEDRFFVNTPSTVSRTECEVSTSQVDSSALENLPLKRSSRSKNAESIDIKIQQRIKEGTGKLKSQAGKLKSKLQNIKTKQFTMPDKPKFNLPDRPKFKMPERPKINFPERPKFTLPDRRKFSLPDRPKFKKINISEKLSLSDKKKFTLPDRPKFNVPDLPKFKMPDRPKINFPSLNRKKVTTPESNMGESSSEVKNVATVDFETKTYPRLFSRKKKTVLPKTSSSPTLNREDTPPPTFIFTRVKKTTTSYVYNDASEEPREYGVVDDKNNGDPKMFVPNYDFNKIDVNDEIENKQSTSISDISQPKQEYTHINEINNDEFFVRPRVISRENIQVREYLSDEIRQAFKIPTNVLSTMGDSNFSTNKMDYADEADADPELMLDQQSEENETMDYLNEDLNDRDDGYYTFPPVRPSREKRKKKDQDSIKYIDDSVNVSMQFSDIDLMMADEKDAENVFNGNVIEANNMQTSDQQSTHQYANDDLNEYPDLPIQSQTLPMPPKRKKKLFSKEIYHSSLHNVASMPFAESWQEADRQDDDIIVYRTAHEYVVPEADTAIIEHTPEPPRRTRSRSSRGTSFCDDDRTSHGAESLTLDTHIIPTDYVGIERDLRQESPGYATVDKSSFVPKKHERRSISKTPPVRRRKSSSSERKYYTVGPSKPLPGRPPRKKSSTSLMTLESLTKKSDSGDYTQYVEIDQAKTEDTHKDLHSGEVLSKMKDRPLPPPPRPPRGPKRKKEDSEDTVTNYNESCPIEQETPNYEEDIARSHHFHTETSSFGLVEIEASTQTDPLPDDIDYELGVEENIDISMSSSLKDIVDEDSFLMKSLNKINESPSFSRPTSRSEKKAIISDPKISELSRSSVGRTSPTVILVERRVSSPTRINERQEMLTEASLTVQHIDVDVSQIPDIPPLPQQGSSSSSQTPKPLGTNQERALDRISDASRDANLDTLITQKLQVRDLDVGRLNVSELQASKILVSDIEGMTLQVTELDSKSGHISVSGIEFSQSVIDEIVKKFAEISTNTAPVQTHDNAEHIVRPVSREEQTQTDEAAIKNLNENQEGTQIPKSHSDDSIAPPQRPPPPDLTPLLYSYLQDMSHPPASFYRTRNTRERPFTEFHESQHQSPPPPARRGKRKPTAPQSDSSSDEDHRRPSPRRMPAPVKLQEPTIIEAGTQFLRVCQNSVSRTIRNLFNSFMSYISGAEDKKDVQMALVIFLVLIAGLIMFGLSDSRTIHHHHWEFFNPPDSNQN